MYVILKNNFNFALISQICKIHIIIFFMILFLVYIEICVLTAKVKNIQNIKISIICIQNINKVLYSQNLNSFYTYYILVLCSSHNSPVQQLLCWLLQLSAVSKVTKICLFDLFYLLTISSTCFLSK